MTAAAVRFNPFDPAFRHDPYPHYAALRGTRPVHRTLGTWVLVRHVDVRAVLRDRSFSSAIVPRLVARRLAHLPEADAARVARLGAASLVFTDDPVHARLRGLVNRVVTPGAVAALRPALTAAVDARLARLAAAGGGDAVAALAAPLPVEVLADWAALPDGVREHAASWTHDVRFLLDPGLLTAADATRVGAVVAAFTGALTDLAAARRSRPGDDLISRLAAARGPDGDRLSDEEVAFTTVMCFVAGTETSTALLGNALLALLRHPDQAGLLAAAPGLVPGAVAEVLRHDSPLQLTKRVATRDARVGGATVRAGEQVLLCLGAANRDPDVFPDPDAFDVTRVPRGHLAFGHGMHGCLGASLASLQAEVVLERLVGRPERWVADGEPTRSASSVLVRGLDRLPVRVVRP